MEWKNIDLIAKEWRYYVTKTDVLHIVPLSTQTVAIREEIKPLTSGVRYVFPSSRGDGRPMSDNTIRTALRTLGLDSDVMTPHGFIMSIMLGLNLNIKTTNFNAAETEIKQGRVTPVFNCQKFS